MNNEQIADQQQVLDTLRLAEKHYRGMTEV
jgi:hypothetical protein